MSRGNVQDIYKLSPVQQGMLFHTLAAPEEAAYFDQFVMPVAGLDAARLRGIWQRVLQRHGVLRTSFLWQDLEEPVQIVHRKVELEVREEDWSALPPVRRRQRLAAFCAADRRCGFDLEKPPLMRLALLRMGGESRLVWSYHHILLDGWSVGLVLREVAVLTGLLPGPPPAQPPRPFRDYVHWLAGQDAAASQAYWRRTLAGFDAPTPLTVELPPGQRRGPEAGFGRRAKRLPAALASGVEALARSLRVTPFTVVQGAWALTLARLSGRDDVVFGLTLSGRPAALRGVQAMVGCFINTLPVRARRRPQRPLGAWLQELQANHLQLLRHEHTPLPRVQRWSEVETEQPLFASLLVFESFLTRRDYESYQRTNYPLAVMVTTGADGMEVALGFDGGRFETTAVARTLRLLETTLAGFAGAAEVPLAALPALAAAERHQLLAEWNDSGAGYARAAASLPRLLAAQARRTPRATALVAAGAGGVRRTLTYRQLDARADRLARRLAALGVGPGHTVGVALERSLELVVALVGVLKAGAAYVPIDPGYPRDRIAFLLADARPPVLLTQEAVRASLPDAGGDGRTTRVLCLDGGDGGDAPDEADDGSALPTPDPADLAYVIYTSGSTGRPKGAMNSHRAIVNRLLWMQSAYRLDPSDRVLQKTPMSFDVSVWEFFWPLLVGARLVLARPGGHRDAAYLARLIAEEGITTLHFVPSMLQAFVETPELEECRSLRRVIASGEALPPELVRRFHQRLGGTGAALHNLYGPTEAAVDVTFEPCPATALQVAIGRPVANTRILLLDRELRPAPLGVPGELHIGGVQLARGYFRRPALTAERFIPDPYGEPGGRLYRTGDLARLAGDGRALYLGRLDFQVKIRGFRIELGEIESALDAHPGVREAVVLAAAPDGGAPRRLVACVVGRGGREPDAEELRGFLGRRLPEHMVPAAFVFLDTMPLTANGKVDRKALVRAAADREAAAPSTAGHGSEPRGATERLLAEVWAEVLGLPQVGVHDNFFQLGGDSILTLRVISKAAARGLALELQQLFENPTVARLAAVVGRTAKPRVEQGPVSGPVPLTPVQRWFFELDRRDPHHWNQALMLDLRAAVPPDHLRRAVGHLMSHHDALRLRFTGGGDSWRQENAPPGGEVPCTTVDLGALPVARRRAALFAAASRLQASFDLARGPLLRTLLFLGDDGAPHGRLLLAAHHLVVDGVSWRVLLEDLEGACRQLAAGEAVTLPPKTGSFRGWAERLVSHAASEELAAELPFWGGAGQADHRATPLPLDRRAGDNTVASSRTVVRALDEDITAGLLRDVPAAYRSRPDDALLAALATVVAHWSGTPRLLVDAEGHGREDLFDDLSVTRTVGWLTSVFPLSLALEAPPEAPGEVLRSIKEQLRRVPRRGVGYGLLRYLAPAESHRRLAELPPAEIRFNYLGQLDEALSGASLFAASAQPHGALRGPRGRRRYLLELDVSIVRGRLVASWTYSTHRHREATVEVLAEAFLGALRSLAEHCRSPEAGGFSPSDFPLAGLGQAELDRLLADDREVEDLYPLTPIQQGLLVHTLASPETYFQQLVVELAGDLDPARFAAAWRRLLERHTPLRTGFLWHGLEIPLQRVWPQATLPLAVIDERRAAGDPRARLEAFLEDDRRRGFDLERPPLVRVTLLRRGGQRWCFVLTYHHLVLDGWSLSQLLSELFATYAGTPAGAPARPYRDYVAWLAAQSSAAAEDFWRPYLAGFTTPTRLATRTPPAGGGRGRASLLLPAAASGALSAVAQRHRLTLNSVLQGAWGLLLGRTSGEHEVVFGATFSGRSAPLEGLETMVGLFINTLPLRLATDGAELLPAWLAELQRAQAEVGRHEASPLPSVQGWSEVPRGQPLFESIVVFESYPLDAALTAATGGGTLGIAEVRSIERTNYPLTLAVAPQSRLSLVLGYDLHRFDTVTGERLLHHLAALLSAIAENPERPHRELPLLTAAERHQLLMEWNTPPPMTATADLVPALIAARARRHPDAVAVAFADHRLTYGELRHRTAAAARRLRRLGVGPEVVVGAFLERSLELVVGVVAVLEAGGAYLPLDPTYPAERLAFMLEDAGVPVVVTTSRLAASLPPTPAHRLLLDAPAGGEPAGGEPAGGEPAGGEPADDSPPAPVRGANPAYVIYTSGSTGVPKGVVISHAALANRVRFDLAAELDADSRYLQYAPFAFDMSVNQIFSTLAAGGRVVQLCPRDHSDPAYLARVLRQQAITHAAFPPPLLQLLLADGGLEDAPRLRQVVSGGDTLSPDLPGHFHRRLTGVTLINRYGPTEATVAVTSWSFPRPRLHPGEPPAQPRVPIGRSIAGARLYVADRRLRLVPPGVAGELALGGPGLARGYLGRPALTAERFVPSPDGTDAGGGRLYRTGDLARHRGDGALEFVGRVDHQVKIRGHRIELGEVESQLRHQPEVHAAAVIDVADAHGSHSLVAYVVFEEARQVPPGELRRRLSEHLPATMVPSDWVEVEALPLGPNGKVDRRALRREARPATTPEEATEAPRTPSEELLAVLWSELLGRRAVGRDDDFFDLGGHSLLATRAVSRLRRTFGVELPLRALFEHPTLAGLARAIDAAGRRAPAAPIMPLPPDAEPPLSFAQERLWFLDQLLPESPVYNIALAAELHGRLSVAALAAGLTEVARRHRAVRGRFRTADGRPRQSFTPTSEVPLPVVDLGRLGAVRRRRQAAALARAEAGRPFDLAAGPLLRATLLRLGEAEHTALFTMHHIVSDGGSMQVLLGELATLYGARTAGRPSTLPELPLQYADFAAWQRRQLQGERLEAELAHWRDRLAGAPTVLELPTDRPYPAVAGNRGDSVTRGLPEGLPDALTALGSRCRVTLFMILLAAWQTLLGRLTGRRDLLVGTPIANRQRLETEGLIGLFVNTLVLRGDLTGGAGGPGFAELLARTRAATLDAYAHQELPFERLVGELAAPRDLAHTPLFQTMLVLQSSPPAPLELPGLTLTQLPPATAATKFDLSLTAVARGAGSTLTLAFRTDLFDRTSARRLLGAFERLLAAATADPERRLGELSLLAPGERQQLLVEWNDTQLRRPEGTLHGLFEARAERHPEAVAALFRDQRLTYGELEARANRLANHLLRLGVGPDAVVGICLERSLELVVALVAVLKAGGAYVPLDPGYPAERLELMAADAGLAVLVTRGDLAERLPAGAAHHLCLDAERDEIARAGSSRPRLPVAPEHLAYVIYTSGSTGRPKGATCTHRAVVNRMHWLQERYRLAGAGEAAPDRVLQKTPLSFDVSVWEVFWPLTAGAQMVLARPDGHRDPAYLRDLILEHGVTTVHFVPSMLRLFLEEPGVERCCGLRRVIASGEALGRGLVRRFAARFKVPLDNMYGPSEAARASFWPVDRELARGVAPIGRPIPNLRLSVLDRRLRPVAVGVPGELTLGGVGLGRGYHRRPAATAERFVPDPTSRRPGERLYRTGDLTRLLPSGDVEFLGRIDHQVKIRGMRVELGEIETALLGRPEIREAVVLARQDAPGVRRLAAYLVSAGDPDLGELRGALGAILPDYMVPAVFVPLAALPLLPSGKVDRAALPAPGSERPELAGGYTAPSTPAESALAEIWAAVLGLAQVGVDDNFFELGGDSILSIQVISAARRRGLVLRPQQIFQHPTVAALAAVAGSAPAAAAEQGPVLGPAPLTPIQRAFFADLPAEPQHWNQSLMLAVPRLEAAALAAALAAAVARLLLHHDALRLRFAAGPDGWGQRHAPPGGPTPCHRLDLSGLPEGRRDAALEAVAAQVQRSLDLERGPLLRTVFCQLGDGGERPHRLLLVAHHLVVDGVSWRILAEDLERTCHRLAAGTTPRLDAKTTAYRDWAEHLAEHAGSAELAAELEFWAAPERRRARPLPVERHGANTVAAARTVEVSLGRDATEALLRQVPAAWRTRIDDVLLTALAQAFGRWTGERSLLLTLEGHGREDLFEGVDLSRTVGWLTAAYPVQLRLAAAPGADFGADLKTIKEQLRAIPRRGLGYGVLRYLGPEETRRRLAALPPAEVSFNYLGQIGGAAAGASLFAPTAEPTGGDRSPRGHRRHLLDVTASLAGGRLRVAWIYSANRHRRTTVEALAEGFLDTLTALIEHCTAAGAGGATPSDFPLTQLDQGSLDRLLGDAREVEDLYPLSPLQEGILLHSAVHRELYFQQMRVTFRGALDSGLLHRAYQRVVDRHPILRSAFRWRGLRQPLQLVRRHAELPFTERDWRRLAPAQREAHSERFLAEDRERGFDLERAPLLRLGVLRLGDDLAHVVFSHHHLLLDGWSIPILLREIFACYGALAKQREPALPATRPYRDYIAWLADQDRSEAEVFWRRHLAGLRQPTPLAAAPASGPLLAAAEQRHQRFSRHLPPAAVERLEEAARRHRLTLSTLVQGAWALLLWRAGGEEDVLFGATVSGRTAPLPGLESMLGLFINTLPVRARVERRAAAGEWLAGLQRRQAEAGRHEHTPLVAIQGWSEVPRALPLFESLVVFESYPMQDAGRGADLGIVETRHYGWNNYPVALLAVPRDGGLVLGLEVDTRRFTGSLAGRWLRQLDTLLGGLAAAPEARLEEVSPLTAAERQQLLREWGHGPRPAPAAAELLLHRLVAARAASHPETPAVSFPGTEEDGGPPPRQLTYRQLVGRAATLAARLRQLGVGPETPVGLCVERSADLVTAMLGILAAGGAYVPLDPSYPAERLRFVLTDTAAPVVVTERALRGSLPQLPGRVLCLEDALDDGDGDAPDGFHERLDGGVGPDHLAYVIYTSGSTGNPKGVRIPHRAAARFLAAMARRPGLHAGDVLLAVTTPSFDIALLELLGPLTVGARVVVAPRPATRDGRHLARLLGEHRATVLQATPATWQLLLESGWRPSAGLAMLCGGEPLPRDLAARLLATDGPAAGPLWNLYGPTETTVWSAVERLTASEPISIGRPIDGTELLVVDPSLRPLPAGAAGELAIGGAGVARGYFGRPDLTAERFVPHPHAARPGALLYKTGDLARFLPDGRLEVLGRFDQQVKVRGFRVELGEVEAVLRRHPAVAEAAVVAQPDHLAAFVVAADPECPPAARELRDAAACALPDYMVPAHVALLGQLPLTANRKVDRAALSELTRTDSEARTADTGDAFAAPRDALELELARIWEEVLERRPIGVRQSFFDLGGHSLLAARTTAEIHRRLGAEVPLAAFVREPTIEALAARLRRGEAAPAPQPLVALTDGSARPPFFCVHPASGEVLCYRELAGALGPEQPFYGLQAVGLEPDLGVERLAARYLEQVRQRQSEAPYFLGGWSFGGLVAYEMARQLRRQGLEVGLLALFDTAPGPSDAAPRPEACEAARVLAFLERFMHLPVAHLRDRLEPIAAERRLDALAEALRDDGRAAPDLSATALRRHLAVHDGLRRAAAGYTPGPYDGRLSFFRAARQPDGADPAAAWRRLAAEVEVHDVAGDHDGMVFAPHVETLAARLGQCLEQAPQPPTPSETEA